ncbi:hypothetical protein [Variovorax sp. HW608]|uniref:hypothetical protein n=1 Tax=Variovorax sp. HW608 TaxID=1034889 RepID=UPI0012FD2953|nr:hypothetical protein [Variovorax sp. HW608]
MMLELEKIGGYCDEMQSRADAGKHLAFAAGIGFLRDQRLLCAIIAQSLLSGSGRKSSFLSRLFNRGDG